MSQDNLKVKIVKISCEQEEKKIKIYSNEKETILYGSKLLGPIIRHALFNVEIKNLKNIDYDITLHFYKKNYQVTKSDDFKKRKSIRGIIGSYKNFESNNVLSDSKFFQTESYKRYVYIITKLGRFNKNYLEKINNLTYVIMSDILNMNYYVSLDINNDNYEIENSIDITMNLQYKDGGEAQLNEFNNDFSTEIKNYDEDIVNMSIEAALLIINRDPIFNVDDDYYIADLDFLLVDWPIVNINQQKIIMYLSKYFSKIIVANSDEYDNPALFAKKKEYYSDD